MEDSNSFTSTHRLSTCKIRINIPEDPHGVRIMDENLVNLTILSGFVVKDFPNHSYDNWNYFVVGLL